MKWALLFALGTTGAVIVALCLLTLLVRHRLHRRHRVDPAVRTSAPLRWLVDPRGPARLHRRLAKVGHTAGGVADEHRPRVRRLRRKEEPPAIVAVADDLRAHAVLLDRQLAQLMQLAPQARHQPVAALARSVEELEQAATRLVALSRQVQAPLVLAADDPTLLSVTAQVDRLAEAHQALLDLDADAGLVPEPAARPAPPAATEPPLARQARR